MLKSILDAHKDQICGEWVEALVGTYPEGSSGFLLNKKDRFQNPMGYTFRTELPRLVDEVLGSMSAAVIDESLDNLMKIRAVQDFSPSQAASFLFELKTIIRRTAGDAAATYRQELIEVDRRIDQIALRAFDLYVENRERLYQIRIRELKSRTAQFMRGSPSGDDNSGGDGLA